MWCALGGAFARSEFVDNSDSDIVQPWNRWEVSGKQRYFLQVTAARAYRDGRKRARANVEVAKEVGRESASLTSVRTTKREFPLVLNPLGRRGKGRRIDCETGYQKMLVVKEARKSR